MSIEIVKATVEDVHDLQITLEQARAFKCALGDNLWGTDPYTLDEVEAIIARGDTFVAKVKGQHAGSVTLSWNDQRIWGERGVDGQAGYIHKLATREAYRGQQVGRQVIAFVCDQIRNTGRPWARLDCSYENRELCGYYEALGFEETARIDFKNPRYAAALYQKLV